MRCIYLKDDILIQNDMYVPPGISSTSSATRNYYPLLLNPNDCDLLSEQIAFQIYLLNAVYFWQQKLIFTNIISALF